MATYHNITRFAGDTDNSSLEMYTDATCLVALPLTGRTFAGHVKNGAGTEVLAFTTITPSGTSTNELILNPDTGGWEDLTAGTTYTYAVWEKTGGPTGTLFFGSVVVANR